jgi:hypothetical protein
MNINRIFDPAIQQDYERQHRGQNKKGSDSSRIFVASSAVKNPFCP